jgi:hypothetical protein
VAQDHEVEQLLASLRRAQESPQLDHRPAAMQALIQAEEQLDQVAADSRDTEPWQRIELALQDAMEALGEDNPKYAQIGLERVVGPLEGESPAGMRLRTENAQQYEQARWIPGHPRTWAELAGTLAACFAGGASLAIEIGVARRPRLWRGSMGRADGR